MEKYLLQVEFRYDDIPSVENDGTSRSVKTTVGIYDTFDEACSRGNDVLEKFESRFELHTFPDGAKAKKDRFGKIGKYKLTLITNLAYLKTPFSFFVKISTLNFDNVEQSVDNVLDAVKRYQQYK